MRYGCCQIWNIYLDICIVIYLDNYLDICITFI